MNTMTRTQIKRALEDAGYTQMRLAQELNVSHVTIHGVIKGTCVSHRIRCRIAKAIGKPVEEVFRIKPNPSKTGPIPSVQIPKPNNN